MNTECWKPTKNLLCVRLDALGDVLMTNPAFRAFKETSPECKITLLTSPSGSRAAELMPEIDEIITYDAPWMKHSAPRLSPERDINFADELRRKNFDGAVIFTVYSQNPAPAIFMCYLAGIPQRLAYCRENLYQLITHPVQEIEPTETIRHEVERQLTLAAHVGATTRDIRMRLRVPPDARRRIHEKIERLGIDKNCPWLVLHSGASAPSRRYPPRKFAEVIRMLVRDLRIQVILTGTNDEVETVSYLQSTAEVKCHSLTGDLPFAELAALIQEAPLLISNNTGPAHVAAAVGTPVVDIYALTNMQHTPWQVPNRVLNRDVPCRMCYKSVCPRGDNVCISKVEPAEIVNAVEELLDVTKGMKFQ